MIRKTAATAALSLAILTGASAPTLAATESPAPASSQESNESHGNAGLWGLVGLAGLAGLLKKNKTVPADHNRNVGSTDRSRHAGTTTDGIDRTGR